MPKRTTKVKAHKRNGRKVSAHIRKIGYSAERATKGGASGVLKAKRERWQKARAVKNTVEISRMHAAGYSGNVQDQANEIANKHARKHGFKDYASALHFHQKHLHLFG